MEVKKRNEMNQIIFECETIIKGGMRFWWRVINGNLSLNDLRDRENKVYGIGGKSAVWYGYFN